MSIHLDQFIDGLERPLPALHAGELHLCVVEDMDWLKRLVIQICSQTAMLYINEPRHSLPLDFDFNRCNRGSRSAEWKPIKHYSDEGLTRTLTAVSKPFELICMHFSSRQPSRLLQFLLDQDGLFSLRRWARNSRKVVMLIVDGDKDTETIKQYLARHAASCHSVSTIYQGQPHWRWDIQHWFNGSQMITHKLRLQALPDQRYQLVQDNPVSSTDYQLLHEQAPVYYINGALDGNEVAPLEWLMLDNIDDWLQKVTPRSDDALILGYFRGQSIHQLLRTVFEIRQHCGVFVRLYIRERDQAIRHHDERLLLQAGATLVLPFGLRFSQVVSLVENSSDWRFNRQLPETFEHITDQLVPNELQGYQTLPQFAESIVWLAQLAERQGVDFTLVKARPAAGMSCLDLLKAFKHRREGDLCSSDGKYVYFFLFACRAADADRALTFLFGLPVQTLLDDEQRMHSLYLMQRTRDELVGLQHVIDYHSQLTEHAGIVERIDDAYDRFFPSPAAAKPAKLS